MYVSRGLLFSESEMWEISENLHRAELTVVQRSEQVFRWVELSDRVSGQVVQKPLGGRPEGGVSKAARDLNLERTEVHRSQAHALAIRARAEMRLAEEYDQAQDDNVVRKAGNPIVVDPNNCKVGPADLGLRRDEIHAARKLRDAERDDPVGFVVSLNLRRRHLSEGQRAWVAAQIANLGKGRPSEENPPIGGLSQPEAATMMNVSERAVQRATVVRDHGVPELQAKVASDYLPWRAASSNRRMASGRDGESDCFFRQASTRAMSAGCILTPIVSPRPVAGRPLGFLASTFSCFGMALMLAQLRTEGKVSTFPRP